MSQLGPYSTPDSIAKLDGRTREARRLKQIRAELVQHLGGSPSPTQKIMIDRSAILLLRLEIMDREALGGAVMSDHDQRAFLGWSNSLARMLRHLGLKGAAGKAPTLVDYLAKRDGAE